MITRPLHLVDLLLPLAAGVILTMLLLAEARRIRRRDARELEHAIRPTVALDTLCLHCSHPYSWHISRGACAVGIVQSRCGCHLFAPGEAPEPDFGDQHTNPDIIHTTEEL